MFDVCVIGGGPAGMMAAGRAAENGASVVLLEKNSRLGVKLLITGKGRCNITNIENDLQFLTKKYGNNGKFLFSSLASFGGDDVIGFFEDRGVKTKVERGGRVFPVSDKSMDVLNALKKYLNENTVEVVTNALVKKVVQRNGRIENVVLNDRRIIQADKFIVCTGGKSYPATGSDGKSFSMIESLGHSVVKLRPALVPIICKNSFIKDLEGLSLKNVEVSAWQDNKKQVERFGEALFTDTGMSGPIILDMSKEVDELLNKGSVQLKIDFKPALTEEELDKRIQKDFQEFNNKMFRNSLDKLLPKKMIPVIIKLSKIDPDKKVNLITREERKALLSLFKGLILDVNRVGDFLKAIITSGGVELKEVNPKTMQSKLIDNLYFAGEALDLDGPTGGYNLQVAWSTGFVAGDSIT